MFMPRCSTPECMNEPVTTRHQSPSATKRAEEGTVLVDGAGDRRGVTADQRGDQPDRDVDADDDLADDHLGVAPEQRRRADHPLRVRRGAVRTLEAHRRLPHALRADRPVAPLAAHPGGSIGVSMATDGDVHAARRYRRVTACAVSTTSARGGKVISNDAGCPCQGVEGSATRSAPTPPTARSWSEPPKRDQSVSSTTCHSPWNGTPSRYPWRGTGVRLRDHHHDVVGGRGERRRQNENTECRWSSASSHPTLPSRSSSPVHRAGRRPWSCVQVPDESAHAVVLRLGEQPPVELAVVGPLALLGQLAAHEQQLATRVAPLPGQQAAEVGELLPVGRRASSRPASPCRARPRRGSGAAPSARGGRRPSGRSARRGGASGAAGRAGSSRACRASSRGSTSG